MGFSDFLGGGLNGAASGAAAGPFGAIAGLAGGIFSSIGASKAAEAQRQAEAAKNASGVLQTQDQQYRNNGIAANNAAPIGWAQNFQAKNALKSAILAGMKPVQYAGQRNPGAGPQAPGGFSPEQLNRLYGDGATAASIGNYQNQLSAINPNQTKLDFNMLGYQPEFAKAMNDATGAYQGQQKWQQNVNTVNQNNMSNATMRGEAPSPLMNAIIGNY